MMNMILSIFMCFAMILGGTMPAVPETATTWTISNLTLSVGDESVTLEPELRYTSAMGSEKSLMHFEVGVDEQTILPASAEITPEGVRFAIGNNGHSYSVSDETLTELIELDAETAQMLGVVTDFFKSYGTVLGLAIHDMDFALKFSETAMQAMIDACGTTEETEIEIEGETYPAQKIHFELSGSAMLDMLDALRSCGIAEVEEMIASCLKLVGMSSGEEIDSFAVMEELIEEDISIPMDMIIVNAEDFIYQIVSMEMYDEYSETAVNVEGESIVRGAQSMMNMSMTMDDGFTTFEFGMSMEAEGESEDNMLVNASCNVYAKEDYSYPEDGEDAREFVSVTENYISFDISGEIADGLENMKISASADTSEEYGYDGDVASYDESVGMEIACTETLEADGSVTASWIMDIESEDGVVGFAFDVNRAEGAVQDYFAGATDYALTAEVLASMDGDTPGQEMMLLGTDAMAFAAEAYALTADESVMQLMEMFTAIYEGELYTDKEVETVTEDDVKIVHSLEEAAAIYGGKIPDYTAPDGYALTDVYVGAESLTAYYEGEKGSFEMHTYDYYDDSVAYYTMGEDGLKAIDSALLEFYSYDDETVSYVEVNGDGYEATFYLYGDMDMAAAGEVLSGLK